MKPHRNSKSLPAAALVFFLVCLWIILPSKINDPAGISERTGMDQALASSQYGIRGQTAPELRLDTWIDQNGEKTAPIRLSDYRGKVIYLYFFQDW